MDNPICLITGANAGIGRVTALELAKKGMYLLLVCRNRRKGEAVQQEIQRLSPTCKTDLYICDLADLDAVASLVATVKQQHPRLDILINNAGVIVESFQISAQGFESTFAVNHLAPFLLTNLLLDLLKKSSAARIITVASEAHRWAKFDLNQLASPAKFNGLRAYANSKLANILFTKALAGQLLQTGITANSLHPGAVQTSFASGNKDWYSRFFQLMRPFFITPEKGAETTIYLADSEEVNDKTGLYFDKKKPRTPSADAQSEYYAQKLWELSRQLTDLDKRLLSLS